ncbi:hypothetical protein Egran_06315 [Elaphomyces granulatus]|uniref:Yeast cell wall synthesis Kre9/Knh1-like N-terminal domain-containing protein n=1 Tax=Elaphomyces granulatus TaxID=519963 RepID=A0A232LP45_9EURO|nr:hypothetical protein Egran_06315 [Elaphomyces granulatus]
MQFAITGCLIALAASVAALQVNSPAIGAVLDLSKSNAVTWSTVNTDPSSFNIVLVNNHVNPSFKLAIASNVQSSSGSFTVSPQSGVSPGDGYQFNLESTDPKNTGILAQSQQFTVASSGSATSGGSASSASSTSSASAASDSAGSSATSVSSLPTPVSATPGSSTKASTPASSSSNPSAPKSSGGAAKLPVVAGAGSILMGLFALVL